jgi:hypothetical protein
MPKRSPPVNPPVATSAAGLLERLKETSDIAVWRWHYGAASRGRGGLPSPPREGGLAHERVCRLIHGGRHLRHDRCAGEAPHERGLLLRFSPPGAGIAILFLSEATTLRLRLAWWYDLLAGAPYRPAPASPGTCRFAPAKGEDLIVSSATDAVMTTPTTLTVALSAVRLALPPSLR